MSGLASVAPGVLRLEGTVSGTRMPLALHLVACGGDDWLLLDTGCVGMIERWVLPALRSHAPNARIRTAVISHAHADHFGGNAELVRAQPGCRLLVHRDDAAWASDPAWHVHDAYGALADDHPCPDEVKAWVAGLLGEPAPVERLEAGDVVALAERDLRVLHLPGHSPGHLGLWDAEHGTLWLGDALLGDGQRIDGEVVGIPSYLSVDAYLGSLRAVRALDPECALPAHFPVMDRPALRDFCDRSEAFVARLEEAIVGLLADRRPRALRTITERVVPALAPRADVGMVASLSVMAHLEALERHGVVARRFSDGHRHWERA